MSKNFTNKTHLINFRVTQKEYDSICYDMRDMDIKKISDYMRMLCLKNPNRKNLLISKNYLISEFQEIINKIERSNCNIDDDTKEVLNRLEEELWKI